MRPLPVMGAACLDGWIVSGTVARSEVQRWLPAGVDLTEGAWASADVHPIVCICGNLTETTILLGGVTIPTGITYREFALLVPCVRYRAGRAPLAFVLRMYASVPMAVLVGNTYYGFAKEEATISRHGPVWSVIGADGTIVAHATFQRRAGAAADLSSVRAWLALPLLGRKVGGTFITSRFEWDFDAAAIRPADGRLVLAGAFIPRALPVECDAVPGGTFEVSRLRWRLSWPSTAVGSMR